MFCVLIYNYTRVCVGIHKWTFGKGGKTQKVDLAVLPGVT